MKLRKYLGIILASALLLTACGGKTPAKPDNNTGNSNPTNEVTENDTSTDTEASKELTVWASFADIQQEMFTKLSKDFSDANDVSVNVQYIPFGDYKKQLSVAIASDSLPDLIMIDNPDHAAFASMGIFEDITERMNAWDGKDNYFEGPMASTMLDGKYYGLPVTSNCLALFYNEDMLSEAGVEPPTNWAELQEAAKKLTTDEVFGLGVAAPKNEQATFQFLPWIISAGGSYDKVNSPETISALTLWADLIEDGSMSKETINWAQGDVQKQFSAGKLAMFEGGSWAVPQIEEDSPDLNWGVVKIPRDQEFASVLGGENIGIIKGKNVDLAWEFLKHVGSFDTVKDFLAPTGYFPPRKDVAQDPIWTEDPIRKVFVDQMQYAMPRGPHPKWPEVSASIYTALQEALTFTKTPEEALNDAQITIDELLSK